MKWKAFSAFLFCFIILYGCAGQKKILFRPVPEDNSFNEPEYSLVLDDVIETQNGAGNENLPEWLLAFSSGGMGAVERMDFFRDRYCFIVKNEGTNFDVLKKWAENYSAAQDFSRLAAARIERRLISAALLYPDDEYGVFFERLMKKAFGAEYSGAVKEDTYWIRTGEGFEFFILISIDFESMQEVVSNMIADVYVSVAPTRTQRAAINRLQQNFFEGF